VEKERAWRVHTPLAVRRVTSRRSSIARRVLRPGRGVKTGWLTAVSLATIVAALGISGSAGAAAKPTVAQVQKKIAAIDDRTSKLGQQYDEVLTELHQANLQLKLINKQTGRYRATFQRMRRQIGKLAAVAYEQAGVDSPIGLLTTASPRRVLSEASILDALSVADTAQIDQYLGASRQLLSSQQAAARTRLGILQLKHSLGKRLAVLKKLKLKEETLLALLTPAQQAGLGPGTGSGGSSGKNTYKGPTTTQAEKAVAFAYDQIGCPYVWGGTGPCADGFDCSGLVMEAWAAAGISIPRTSYAQIEDLPAVPLHTSSGAFTEKYLEPGDILGFAGNSHVGMYVGGGYLIDAPQTGEDVEKVALSGWYMAELDGAVRP
jgi:peptidoglycan DL-endopeptidase CwlO